MREIDGNLITLAQAGEFDVITHGYNCFCTMGSGIAPQIKKAFPAAWEYDLKTDKGDIQKLGTYSYGQDVVKNNKFLTIINSYTQYHYDASKKPLDYEALTLCMRKINHNFKGKSIGLPLIGCGLAGGDWQRVKSIIERELSDMDVCIVHYRP